MKSGEKNRAMELLNNWYKADIKQKPELLKIIDVPEVSRDFENMINQNAKLLYLGKITKFPSIFINGFPLPSIYSIEEIRHHIPSLILIKQDLTK
jgi:hypothetical protein